jgi:Spy/CpxP family protein refolding chaperone
MKFAKQLALAALVGSLVATSAMAYNGSRGDCDGSPKMERKSQMGDCAMRGQNKSQKAQHKGQMGQMRGMANLNLTPEQLHEIKVLKAQMRVEHLKAKTPGSSAKSMALSQEGFDKEAFIKAQTDRAKQKAEIKATYMEKLYNILTPEQRQQWVKNMESCPKRS